MAAPEATATTATLTVTGATATAMAITAEDTEWSVVIFLGTAQATVLATLILGLLSPETL